MRRVLWVSLLSLVAGCAEAPFSPHARDNSLEDIQHALAQTGTPPRGPRSGRAMAFVVTPAPGKHLAGIELEGGKVAWDVAADVTSRVVVGRGFIAEREGDELVVRAAQTGQRRCAARLRSGETFLGMAADERVYYASESKGGITRSTYVTAVSPDGCADVWRDEASGSVGAPAARGGLVAVPYLHQSLVFLDGKTGAEVARVREQDEEITFVRASDDGFFYGANSGIYRFDPKSAAGTKQGASFASAKLASSQIRTFYYYDGYQVAQAGYTAFDRNRLLWLPEAKGDSGVGFKDDAAFLHSYRFFFGFDAAQGTIKWAYAHPRVDVVASDATGPAIAFVSADGEVGALDARTGALLGVHKTGMRVAGATLDAEGWKPEGAATEARSPKNSISETLASIVWDPDSRFIAVKVFAVDAMAKLPGRDVTAALVKIVLKEGEAPQVAQKAAESLVARKDGDNADLYRDALAVHYDYLADRHPHGVDVLARVEAAVADKKAAPALADHLMDPATPLHALKDLVKSLVTLGGKSAIKPLRDLVLTYRCDPQFLADPAALEAAVDGLITIGGPEERRLVTFVAEEPRTLQPLAAYMHRALADTAPKPKPKPKAKPGEDRPAALK